MFYPEFSMLFVLLIHLFATLKQTKNDFLHFVWAYRGRWIGVSTLYTLCRQGDLVTPQLIKYYQAARLDQLSQVHLRSHAPHWVAIEATA